VNKNFLILTQLIVHKYQDPKINLQNKSKIMAGEEKVKVPHADP
jgi:hypothetical protein